jgi:hypothetical protein
MMAKMFYTLDETRAALGKNEEEIKQYAREGRLREFRDGPRLMFKADQVEALKNELGIGGGLAAPDMGPSDSGGPIGLVDSRGGGSATGISLVDTDLGMSRGGSGAGMQLKDDTALAGDVMSGSLGGVPSPGRPGSSSGNLAGSRAGGSGINVLGDSAAPADPMAQTAISGGGMADQISLEGTGSGSGLLDLTRESDDTSLGAELLDEIAPGGSKRGTKAGSAAGRSGSAAAGDTAVGDSSIAASTASRRGATATAAVVVERADPMAPLLGGAALGAAVMVLFAGFALMSAILDTRPQLLDLVAKMSLLIMLGIGVGVAAVGAVFGLIAGKTLK